MASEHAKRKGAAAAAAAMDELDAADTGYEPPERPEVMARYRELPPVTGHELADHVRGGARIADGSTHQVWDWTNADVARCVGGVLAERFSDLPLGRALGEDQGFDADGNRLLDGAVVAPAGERFNDVLRAPDGSRRYGSGRGLETAEIQLLRTRYHRLVVTEADQARQAESQRRFARRAGLYVALLALIVAGIAAGLAIDVLSS